jgi:D-arabinitol 2-dehydrogenase
VVLSPAPAAGADVAVVSPGDRLNLTHSLVSAAGIVENFVAHEYPTDKVKKLMDVNVMGSWYCALEAAKRMPEGGSIVLVGSMSGSVVNVPQPQTPYNFSSASVVLDKG